MTTILAIAAAKLNFNEFLFLKGLQFYFHCMEMEINCIFIL